MELAPPVANQSHQASRLPPSGWRNGHYNRSSLFLMHGFTRCGVSLDEPDLPRTLTLLKVFARAGEPTKRHKRANPRFVNFAMNNTSDPFITAGFDPLSGDVWVRSGLHDLSKPPFCFTNLFHQLCAAGMVPITNPGSSKTP